jgi:hypothetical protein
MPSICRRSPGAETKLHTLAGSQTRGLSFDLFCPSLRSRRPDYPGSSFVPATRLKTKEPQTRRLIEDHRHPETGVIHDPQCNPAQSPRHGYDKDTTPTRPRTIAEISTDKTTGSLGTCIAAVAQDVLLWGPRQQIVSRRHHHSLFLAIRSNHMGDSVKYQSRANFQLNLSLRPHSDTLPSPPRMGFWAIELPNHETGTAMLLFGNALKVDMGLWDFGHPNMGAQCAPSSLSNINQPMGTAEPGPAPARGFGAGTFV